MKLDPEYTRKIGHYAYHMGGTGCSTAAFYAIISQLKEKVKYPYIFIPIDMMFYGAGGVGLQGSLCGAKWIICCYESGCR